MISDQSSSSWFGSMVTLRAVPGLSGDEHFSRSHIYPKERGRAGGDHDHGVQSLFVQTEDLVKLVRLESFHRAGVDAEQGGAVEEIARADIGLPRGRSLAGGVIHAVDDPADESIAKGVQGLDRDGANLRDEAEILVDIAFGDVLLHGEDDEVDASTTAVDRKRRIGVAGGFRDRPRGSSSTVAGQCGPIVSVDLPGGIELFGGVTPVELCEQLFARNRVHNCCSFFFGLDSVQIEYEHLRRFRCFDFHGGFLRERERIAGL